MPPSLPTRRWTLLLAGVGGLVTETAFPDKSWWPMAYLGVALLLLALRRDSARWGFVVGFLWGLGFFLPHLWWANEAVGEPIGWIALSVAEAGAIGSFGALWVWVRRGSWVRGRPWLGVLAVAVVWVAVEQVRGRWPFGGFPWGALAYSQTDAPLLRLAAVGGTTFVSAVVVVLAALLAHALADLRRLRIGAASAAFVVGAAVLLAPWAVPTGARAEAGTLRVGAVQGNVPEQGAAWDTQARAVAANHAAGTEALVAEVGDGRLDLVLWPESASDIDPRTDDGVAAVVDGAAAAAGVPILLGTQRFTGDVRYNDYILWQAGAGGDVAYTKQHPVPFGEYMPHRDFFRQFTSAVDLVGTDMLPGTGMALLPVPVDRLARTVPVTTAICFEVAYDDLIRESVVAGGELIVIPTNNASFGRTQESTQQLAMSRFRAVEHGRAVVQVSTVGVSGIISPNGVVLHQSELFTAAQMAQELPLRTSLTLADRLGRWPTVAVAVLTVLMLGAGLLTTLRDRRADRERRGSGSRGATTAWTVRQPATSGSRGGGGARR
ncbi:apolipoprotein N-acyltransferase [Georgenia yuyongxinii]|uniref:Apolipoprotein N-acyltransferase n=1 Tax=Georgenia yuyongxinii TaxID=2589797 RepID=A0A5B8C2H2_9MICO|nr:apolipoprotein N-acyltransferase [Georgenia yuyongxinii]QDC24859.1 apolipoprotein N-acyltransferase [Georgenia yuyongxinii]